MLNIKGLLLVILTIIFLSSIQSSADTFVVTNLNDPGAGSLRQAIVNSNLNPGPDEIDFEEALEGAIFLNVGPMSIQDDLTDSSSPNGINGYHLFATNINAMFPIIDIFVLDSNFTDASCNSFVIDPNLNDWIWTVQAEDNLGNLSSVATGEFMFGPCC